MKPVFYSVRIVSLLLELFLYPVQTFKPNSLNKRKKEDLHHGYR